MPEVDLFISHSAGDGIAARDLRGLLEAAGYSCWMAPDDVTGPDPWAEQILAAIQHSRAMLVLLSSTSKRSTHVAREVGLASGRNLAVLPIRIAAANPEGALEYHLAGLQRLDAFPPPIADHRERILRRLATVVPLSLAPTPAERGLVAAEPGPPTFPVTPDQPTASAATRSRSKPGLSAWARANSMLAGAAVTLVALFLVAAIALALSTGKPGASPSAAGPSASSIPLPSSTAVASRPPPTSTIAPSRPPTAPNGAFPNDREVDLFMALPDFAKNVIADCTRSERDNTSIAAIACYTDDGEHLFYDLYADVAAQQQWYRDWVRSIYDNPKGSCESSPAGDDEWSRIGQPGGLLACMTSGKDSAEFFWTDELRLVTAYWYGSTKINSATGRSEGYQLFLDWTADSR